jgi:hypothetical protein
MDNNKPTGPLVPLAIVLEAAVIGSTVAVTAFAIGAASGLITAAVAMAVWVCKPVRETRPVKGIDLDRDAEARRRFVSGEL